MFHLEDEEHAYQLSGLTHRVQCLCIMRHNDTEDHTQWLNRILAPLLRSWNARPTRVVPADGALNGVFC